MTGTLISFREFLKTGNFGPITPDSVLLDVARKLGAPESFITTYAKDIPTYWRYGKFEIGFEEEAPYKIYFYQIEWASYLEGPYELIKDDIVLLLEGLHGSTRPSEFLLADLWKAEDVAVNFGALCDDLHLNISSGAIEIVFEIDSSFVDGNDAEKYLANSNLQDVVKDIDHRTQINSIVVSASRSEAVSAVDYLHRHKLSGREYLRFSERFS
ncbi:hypothetical protein DTW90_20100 [Neorhizobium sp. P12A]|uniref:hypothetical protein n=1 Tax=Rhizobium/Agrobacterium group TaxID=227290 RepID=UPI0010518DE6|nr:MULTISPECIES: hypothetical protein [Rhizobium/Agrobacterium group]KAA0697681.1 hypothetical protein DTW90_20100 [Neorhizobium sp. P12A]TCR83881.1 hypothetical protein EV561_108105 [Rhizobium sp. BK376]